MGLWNNVPSDSSLENMKDSVLGLVMRMELGMDLMTADSKALLMV